MANVKLPLISASAQGTIADVLTFSHRKGRQKVRFQRKQSYDASDNQTPRRLLVSGGVSNWQAFSAAEKAVYNTRAKGKSYSGYNLYLSEYLKTTAPPEKRSLFGTRSYGYYNYGRQVL